MACTLRKASLSQADNKVRERDHCQSSEPSKRQALGARAQSPPPTPPQFLTANFLGAIFFQNKLAGELADNWMGLGRVQRMST